MKLEQNKKHFVYFKCLLFRFICITSCAIIFVNCNRKDNLEKILTKRSLTICKLLAKASYAFKNENGFYPKFISDLYPKHIDTVIIVTGNWKNGYGDRMEFLRKNPGTIDYLTDYHLHAFDDGILVIEKPWIWENVDTVAYAAINSEGDIEQSGRIPLTEILDMLRLDFIATKTSHKVLKSD